MKIGVDAVLLGSWVKGGEGQILDVGTGCGIISLIIAQRFPDSDITGIDIDEESVEEAGYNFGLSPWSNNLKVRLAKFPQDLKGEERYDLIVSNPPYFKSGISVPTTRREKARHQDSLSFLTLLSESPMFLKPKGKLAMIFPVEFRDMAIRESEDHGFRLIRECFIKNNVNRPVKRIMMEFGMEYEGKLETEHLVLFEDGNPSEFHHRLCKDLYLKF